MSVQGDGGGPPRSGQTSGRDNGGRAGRNGRRPGSSRRSPSSFERTESPRCSGLAWTLGPVRHRTPVIAAFRSVDPPAVQLLDALTGAVDMRRSRLFELLRSTTVALAKRRQTVLAVEDVHWSDRTTRDALLYLTAMAREGRWVLVVTFRDSEIAGRPALREFLDALNHDALLQLKLDALGPQDVAAQIEGITVGEPRTTMPNWCIDVAGASRSWWRKSWGPSGRRHRRTCSSARPVSCTAE